MLRSAVGKVRRGIRMNQKGNLNSTQAKQGADDSWHKVAGRDPGETGSSPAEEFALSSKALAL